MGVIFLDLLVAFDTVHHEILLSVLEKKYYIAGNILKWISTYLQPRNFKVCMDESIPTLRIFGSVSPKIVAMDLCILTYTVEQYLNAYLKM